MDAISECEQVVRHKGQKEEDAPWRLYMRKELFVPWHDPTEDPVCTELVYQQLIRGLRSDEYRSRNVGIFICSHTFLSPPVHMHGELICVKFRLSVCAKKS